MKNVDSDFRKVEVFKHMVKFLEIYGNENFGQSAEVNWKQVWDYCSRCDMLDFNVEVEELVYHTPDEEFRDRVFEFIEKQILDGYPVWRLFTMSKWLYDKCEQELLDNERKKDIEYFEKTKCYRCKHFKNKLTIMYNTLFEPFNLKDFDTIKEFKDSVKPIEVKNVKYNMYCTKREELLNEAYKKKFEGKEFISHFKESNFKENYRFKYNKFNVGEDDEWEGFRRNNEWILNPSKLKRCPYFEESDMTAERFVELYGEIPRYS